MKTGDVVGSITRGTTNPNRLRRCDRWLTGTRAWRWRHDQAPIAVDLGYGASPVTAVELRDRLLAVCPTFHVVGIEIDPQRVAAAHHLSGPGLTFVRGGFEVPLPGGRGAEIIRAFNVLRQYDETEVPAAWSLLQRRLTPDGVVIDGTCDELGRRATWIALERSGPVSLTISVALTAIDRPSDVAERLPKALIHRNIPGERIYDYLHALDRAWTYHAPLSAYGRQQRFLATAHQLRSDGWPLCDSAHRWRLGEITVAWEAVRPRP
ncbi:class I SAM-dependent methyltransferase [Austwickia sp. TVS 96-490-7B]|uniref:class I SAM-dependent methyltransferase n=1 Tax=Austwickia sp. TVS 96-490-7B TaxID=2830843 RepID=UPI001C57725D|nr:class I SAM-dependent methyltransferase [Austwickia sp. TVS 96-490-7B]